MKLLAPVTFRIDREFWRGLRRARAAGLREAAALVAREAKALMPRGGSSRPGELPRTRTGNYRASIKRQVGRTVAFVGPTRPKGAHAGILKHGTRTMGARLVPSEIALERNRSRVTALYQGRL